MYDNYHDWYMSDQNQFGHDWAMANAARGGIVPPVATPDTLDYEVTADWALDY